MNKIKRTQIMAAGGITPEEKNKMGEIVEKWKKIAFCTNNINKDKITDSIYRLYDSAGLKHPRVVIVPSPFVGRLASGIAAAVWYLRKNAATYDVTRAATSTATLAATHAATDTATRVATYDATRAATSTATRVATYAATYYATLAATYDVTRAATLAATHAATDAAIDAATNDATYAATYAATRAATHVATDTATYAATLAATHAATHAATDTATRAAIRDTIDNAKEKINWLKKLIKKFTPTNVKFTLGCIEFSWKLYQGGNMFVSFCAYAESMRDIIGLTGLDCWKKYQAWEDSAINGGFRYMHEEFCIVSDFPERLTIDENNRPHNEHGASHRWRDGFEIYHLHGVRFSKDLYMKIISREMEMKDILKIEDIDQRTQAMKFAKNGLREWYKEENGKKIDEADKIDTKGRNIHYELWEIPEGKTFNKTVHFMIYDCPSAQEKGEQREYAKGVPAFSTVGEAMSWGMSDEKYIMTPENWWGMVPLRDES